MNLLRSWGCVEAWRSDSIRHTMIVAGPGEWRRHRSTRVPGLDRAFVLLGQTSLFYSLDNKREFLGNIVSLMRAIANLALSPRLI